MSNVRPDFTLEVYQNALIIHVRRPHGVRNAKIQAPLAATAEGVMKRLPEPAAERTRAALAIEGVMSLSWYSSYQITIEKNDAHGWREIFELLIRAVLPELYGDECDYKWWFKTCGFWPFDVEEALQLNLKLKLPGMEVKSPDSLSA